MISAAQIIMARRITQGETMEITGKNYASLEAAMPHFLPQAVCPDNTGHCPNVYDSRALSGHMESL
jgi:hypothetical protein